MNSHMILCKVLGHWCRSFQQKCDPEVNTYGKYDEQLNVIGKWFQCEISFVRNCTLTEGYHVLSNTASVI